MRPLKWLVARLRWLARSPTSRGWPLRSRPAPVRSGRAPDYGIGIDWLGRTHTLNLQHRPPARRGRPDRLRLAHCSRVVCWTLGSRAGQVRHRFFWLNARCRREQEFKLARARPLRFWRELDVHDACTQPRQVTSWLTSAIRRDYIVARHPDRFDDRWGVPVVSLISERHGPGRTVATHLGFAEIHARGHIAVTHANQVAPDVLQLGLGEIGIPRPPRASTRPCRSWP